MLSIDSLNDLSWTAPETTFDYDSPEGRQQCNKHSTSTTHKYTWESSCIVYGNFNGLQHKFSRCSSGSMFFDWQFACFDNDDDILSEKIFIFKIITKKLN